ncbi:MAG: hypothetical protein CMJ18_14410 [Phycisphaeraceae bacterium]|nr:hypothetical protein [Phycisphaeraceae bacterium]
MRDFVSCSRRAVSPPDIISPRPRLMAGLQRAQPSRSVLVIVDAIEARDGDRAESILRENTRWTVKVLGELVAGSG